MIVGWELVGVCSFALIGHWWEEKPNSDAALKAFLTNRVGDVGLLVGVIILYFAAGKSFSILDINILANEGGISHTLLMVASLCLITAVMSKSGQFILHTWLPDAMAGPTPGLGAHPRRDHGRRRHLHGRPAVPGVLRGPVDRRLVGQRAVGRRRGHRAVRRDARLRPEGHQEGAGLLDGVASSGFMVTALGVGAWTAALFHLFTHAFFKACLFLGAGSLSHACHHSFNMVDDMGGLRKVMPKTFWTYLIGTLALWPASSRCRASGPRTRSWPAPARSPAPRAPTAPTT